MLAFRLGTRKEQSRPVARSESAERRLGHGVDRRPKVKKFEFQDIFRSADQEAEAQMMTPTPTAQFRAFFRQMAYRRRATAVEQRMDPSFPSASGARLTLLI